MNLKVVSPDGRSDDERTFEMLQNSRQQIDAEISKAVIGQKEIIDQLLIALFAGGHCLITGAPGLAKTLLVNSLAQGLQAEITANPIYSRLDARRYHRN